MNSLYSIIGPKPIGLSFWIVWCLNMLYYALTKDPPLVSLSLTYTICDLWIPFKELGFMNEFVFLSLTKKFTIKFGTISEFFVKWKQYIHIYMYLPSYWSYNTLWSRRMYLLDGQWSSQLLARVFYQCWVSLACGFDQPEWDRRKERENLNYISKKPMYGTSLLAFSTIYFPSSLLFTFFFKCFSLCLSL